MPTQLDYDISKLKIYEKADILEEFSRYEGSEMGEYWSYLAGLSRRLDMASNEFAQHAVEEIDAQLLDIQQNYEWVKTDRKVEIVTNEHWELEYIG